MKRTTILIWATLLLHGCTTPGHPPTHTRPHTPGEDAMQLVTLHVGEQVRLDNGAVLRYAATRADSRCRPGLQCIWAGDLDVQLHYATGAEAGRVFSLHTQLQPREVQIDGMKILLVHASFETQPAISLQIQSAP